MNKLLSAFFALFVIAFAQEGGEESTSNTCEYEAQDITSRVSLCLNPYAGMSGPEVDALRCGCINTSSTFYRERPECIIDPYVDGSYFNTYARMCNTYNCEGCVIPMDCGAGLTKIYDDAMECLALYTSKDKDSYAKRCECLEPLKEAFDTNPDCRNASVGVYENFTSIYEYNFCDNSTKPWEGTCLYEAENLARERNVCLAQATDNCSCLKATTAFYNEHPECIIDRFVHGSAYDTYAGMCRKYKCGDCVDFDYNAGADKIFKEAKACLNRYNPGNQSPDYGRCMCIDELRKVVEYSSSAIDSAKHYKMCDIYSYYCRNNYCDKCSGIFTDKCEYGVWYTQRIGKECIADLGLNGTTEPDHRKCPCLNGTRRSFGYNANCKKRIRDEYIDYLKECSYNGCGNCSDFFSCETSNAWDVNKMNVCFDLLEPEEGETKVPDPVRCVCFKESADYFEDASMCKYDNDETIKLMKRYTEECEFNGCGSCSRVDFNCTVDAKSFENESDACLEMFDANDTAPNTEKCQCIEGYAKFFNSGVCKYESGEAKRVFDKYVSQCNYNKCKNCPGALSCDEHLAEAYDDTTKCLALYTSKDKDSYAKRCECLEPLKEALDENPDCKSAFAGVYENSTSISKYVKKYAEECESNECDSCSLVNFNCTSEAESFENESDACLEMFDANDTAPNTEKCQCIEGYAKFFNSGVCKYESGEAKRVFDKYVSQCSYNKCKNCPGGNGSNGSSHVSPMLTLVCAFVAAVVMLFI